MKIALGADHAGFPLKDTIVNYLQDLNIEVQDYGTFSEEPVDFPKITKEVCMAVKHQEVARGLMICGTGVGASIAANKIEGIRSAVCHDIYSAHQSVEHDDVNVMAIGAQIVGDKLAKDLIKEFLEAQFDGSEEFRRRIDMLENLND